MADWTVKPAFCYDLFFFFRAISASEPLAPWHQAERKIWRSALAQPLLADLALLEPLIPQLILSIPSSQAEQIPENLFTLQEKVQPALSDDQRGSLDRVLGELQRLAFPRYWEERLRPILEQTAQEIRAGLLFFDIDLLAQALENFFNQSLPPLPSALATIYLTFYGDQTLRLAEGEWVVAPPDARQMARFILEVLEYLVGSASVQPLVPSRFQHIDHHWPLAVRKAVIWYFARQAGLLSYQEILAEATSSPEVALPLFSALEDWPEEATWPGLSSFLEIFEKELKNREINELVREAQQKIEKKADELPEDFFNFPSSL